MKKLLGTMVAVLCLFITTRCSNNSVEKKKLPQGPSFDSMLTPDDEGIVKPVNIKSEKTIRIAVLGLENNPFWIPVKNGALKADEELKPYNCKVEWIVPGDRHTSDVYGAAIESAIAQEYDGIVTIAGDRGIIPFIEKAVKSGIPVATFNSETTTKNSRLFFVGADLYKQGESAAQLMLKAIGTKGKVAIITGFASVEAHELRVKGFSTYMKTNAPGINIVGKVESHDKSDIAYTNAQDFMTAHPDLAGIFVAAGGQAGVGAAVESNKKAGKIKIICFDFIDETMKYIQKGIIYGTIGQDPYAQGHDPAVRLFNYLVGRVIPLAGRLVTRADAVTKENLNKFWSPKK